MTELAVFLTAGAIIVTVGCGYIAWCKWIEK